MLSFKEFFNGGLQTNTGWEGFTNTFKGVGDDYDIPTPIVALPGQTIVSTISRIDYNRNPIVIYLSDGTTWKLTKQQWDNANVKQPIKQGVKVEVKIDHNGIVQSMRFI